MKNIQLIKTESLFKEYEQKGKGIVHAINDVSFSINKGQVYGLVGESGSGKSTLGSMLTLLTEPGSGKIYFEGKNVSDFSRDELKDFRKKVQIVFQNPYNSLNPKMRVRNIIEEGLIIHKMAKSKEERNYLVNEMRTMCGLDSSVLDKYPTQLSGGQRQRICIASSMILKPEFLVLDEAVSSLDVLIQAQILNILKMMQKSLKVTYLFISHNLNVISYISDVIGVMYLGSIVEQAPAEELISNPLHPYSKALFSAAFDLNNSNENFSDSAKKRIILKGELPSPVDLPQGCPFASRCKECMEICRKKKPEVKEITPDHFCSCHKI